MEHPCHRCGTAVEDGVPFCPHCGGPQIRVAAGNPGIEVAPAIDASASQTPPASQPASIQWSQALPTALTAGIVAAIVMVIPLGAFGLGMLAGGALSVILYRRRNPGVNLTPGIGARLGAVSGAIGCCIFGVVSALAMLITHGGAQLRSALLTAIEQSAARNSDPEAQQMVAWLKTVPGLTFMLCAALILMVAAFLLFSSVGGAVTAALLRRKDQR